MSLICESIARLAVKHSRRLAIERRLQARPTTDAIAANRSMQWERRHAERLVSMANEIIWRNEQAML